MAVRAWRSGGRSGRCARDDHARFLDSVRADPDLLETRTSELWSGKAGNCVSEAVAQVDLPWAEILDTTGRLLHGRARVGERADQTLIVKVAFTFQSTYASNSNAASVLVTPGPTGAG